MPAANRNKPGQRACAAAARGDASSALIDAAERCYARLGIGATTMEDIAAEAGISRRTLYRYFASHDQVLNAVARRAIDRFWEQFHASHQGITDFCDYLVEALIYTIKYAPRTKTHRILFDQGMLPLVNSMYIANPDYLRDQARAFGEVYERSCRQTGTRGGLDMLMVCEWFNRLAVSFLATPSVFHHSEAELRELFSAMLAPALRNGTAGRIRTMPPGGKPAGRRTGTPSPRATRD